MPGSFIDTNVLVYFAATDARKVERATWVIGGGGTISVQVLTELANVARRKLRLSWPATTGLLEEIRDLLPVVPVTLQTHELGIRLAARYGFACFDSMIVASAILSGCDTLWSEDMQDGLVVEDGLTIRNPFGPP